MLDFIKKLCPPALIYFLFILTQIIIDMVEFQFHQAFVKIIIMIVITYLLNILCKGGMSGVSWAIVFIPFIFMTVIVALLLYIFGLDASTGKLNLHSNSANQSGNLVFSTDPSSVDNTTVSNSIPNIFIHRTPNIKRLLICSNKN